MNRVLIIGCGGAGKSTFARELGRITRLPVVHLDRLFWQAGWVQPEKSAWRESVAALLKEPRWIIDGNYGGTMDQRLMAADTVYFFDMPRWLCFARLLQRYLRWRGRAREDMHPGCPERLDWEFLGFVWTFNRIERPKILAQLAAHKQKLTVFRSPPEVSLHLAQLAQARAA